MEARRITRALLHGWPLPSHTTSESKEDRGRIVVIGGSRRVPGAVALAGEAALRGGAGKLMIITGSESATQLGVALPESAVIGVREDVDGELGALDVAQVNLLREAGAVLVGPGMATGVSPATAQAARTASSLVVDAGSLHADALEGSVARLVLTPHVPEMADLMDAKPKEVAAQPVAFAVAAAKRFNAVVVLKGPTTWIADADGSLWMHEVSAPGLGTSGSGDVLAGLIAGLLARGAEPAQAAAWGVAVHARAGVAASRQIGKLGFLASDLLPRIPVQLGRL
jgi:hydroxyethylthiazole kinase-like uncharacterized protein yjeF